MITIKIHHNTRWVLHQKAGELTRAFFDDNYNIPEERQNLLFFTSIGAGVYAEINIYGVEAEDVTEWAEMLREELFIDKLTVTFNSGQAFGEL